MRCGLPLLAVVWGVVFLVEVWFPSRGQRGRAHARKHVCAPGSFKVAVLFVWLLGTRIWADIPTGVLGSLRFVSKHELRRRIRSTWVCRSSLFYLSHTRSCAVTPAGSNKSGGKPGLSCCCWGSNNLLTRVRDGILSFATDTGLGVELTVLWTAFWGQDGDSIILTVPALLRILEIHLPTGWCRLLTCGLAGHCLEV